jgi:hypothetical protein
MSEVTKEFSFGIGTGRVSFREFYLGSAPGIMAMMA